MPVTRRQGLYHNWISYAGIAIAVLAFIAFVFLLIFHALGGGVHAPYAGLVIFIIVPAFLVFGLLLIPLGMFFERLRWRHNKPASIGAYPRLDLNNPEERRAALLFSTTTLVLVFLSVYGSYRAYRYTESVRFCGALCHRVMQPEYVTHQYSPHARVRCVDCHVGPGAGSFFRTKVQGLIQLYEVARHTYPRPIPFPITALRPVRATCEQCHWPAKFYGSQEVRTVHFLPDKQNTRWEITLLLKVGGGGPWNPQVRGIHWHVGPNTRVEFIATDKKEQDIPWVRYTDLKTGRRLVYATPNAPPQQSITESEIRTVDCVDCHNRPTHILGSPSDLLNKAMAAGYVDPSLPDVKQIGVTLLAKKYHSEEAAVKEIANGVNSYYREYYPDLAKQKKSAIPAAVRNLQDIYRRNFFPYMKVRWDAYADNIGHLDSPGCFRCHDGLHQSSGGQVIGKECTTCHTIEVQGTPGKKSFSGQPEGLPFEHPKNIGGLWQSVSCDQCHSGALP